MIPDTHGNWRTTTSAECERWLHRPDVGVRPPSAQVPRHLEGRPAGDIFRRLVRMNDGLRHAVLKAEIVDAFDRVRPDDVARAAESASSHLVGQRFCDDAELVQRWIADFAPLVLGVLCGIDITTHAADVVTSARALGAAFGPAGNATHTDDADRAVTVLAGLLDAPARERSLRSSPDVGGPCSIDLRANEIGWFFQSFDACTALIGSALLALTRRLTVSSDRGSCEDDVDAAIAHVLTEAPPIHATRRYPTSVIDEGQVSIGCTDIVIVSLDPHDGPAHPFGSGPHLCPAGQLAPLIARHALVALPARLREPQRLRLTGWAPSLAARIPLFEVAS